VRRAILTIGVLVMAAAQSEPRASSFGPIPARPGGDERLARLRTQMVAEQIAEHGVTDSVVLDAMRVVPRHRFVPPGSEHEAYEDRPLPIGLGQTISQPYIVGAMTSAMRLKPKDRVLEIGTGSGYQAAVLAEIVGEVYTIEILAPLGQRAESTLAALGYSNVHVRIGDGYAGWPDKAPFDAIIVTAAPDHIPPALIEQLALGGRMVIPLGAEEQTLVVLTRTPEGIRREEQFGVRFVPMTGQAESTRTAPEDSSDPK
jgi:protein-L-isoaspartate(D-aspartate) O-methyltransferase